MTEAELMQLLAAITPPDETARAAAHTHWASLAKPLGAVFAQISWTHRAQSRVGKCGLRGIAFDDVAASSRI